MRQLLAPLLTLVAACSPTTSPLQPDSGDTALESAEGHTHSGDTLPPESWLPRPSDTGETGSTVGTTGGTSAFSDTGCESGDTHAACVTDDCALTLDIHMAGYAYENTIDIEDRHGNVVASWPPAGTTQANNTTYSWTVSVDPDDITIALIDAWGDGWHGAYVTVNDSAGNVIASTTGSDFLTGSRHELDVRHDCAGTFTVDSADTFRWMTGAPEELEDTSGPDTYLPWPDTAEWPGADACDSADTATGPCSYVLEIVADSDYADMLVELYDSSGNLLVDVQAGELTAEGTYYFPVTLPSDGYHLHMEDTHNLSMAWGANASVRLIPSSGGCLHEADGHGPYTVSQFGYQNEYFIAECDTYTETGLIEWPGGTGLTCEPVLDSTEQATGACSYVLEVRADFDYQDMVVQLTDADGNVLVDIQENDLTSSGFYYYPVNLPDGGYHLHMEDAYDYGVSAWGSNAYVRLVPASGDCIFEEDALASYRVDADDFGVADEYFVMNCEEDTGDSFSWDSGWCEPVIDTADMPAGDCGYVLEVAADYDYAYMGINLTDADGNEILDIASGDLTAEGRYYYPINLPTNGYTLTLLDDYPYITSYWGADAYVKLHPVDDGCFAHDPDAEEWRVDFGGEEIIHFEVDCADDSATFGWDSAWCDVILPDTAALTGCEQLIDVSTLYGYQMGIEIADSSGNVIFDIDYNDLGYYEQYFYTVDMPTGGYQVTLTDSNGNGWDESPYLAPGSLTIWEGNGVCNGEEALFGPYTLPDTNGPTDATANEQTFNLWVDCAADTSADTEDTTWMGDSDWAPPIPEDTETGDSTPVP